MGSVEVLVGPINSGKTRWAIERHVASAREDHADRVLLLLPTRKRVAQARKTILLEHELSALVSPRIMTFQDLVELVLDSARQPASPISDVGRYLVLEGILKHMHTARKLVFFKNVADFPGLVDVIGQLISELKLCEIEPERFSAAVRKRGASRKDEEIATIYSAYQHELHRRNLYDTEGGYWIATEILKSDVCPQLRTVELMIIDEFRTFTSAELTLVKELSKLVPRIVFTLDYERESDRRDLFAASEETMRILKKRFSGIKVVTMEAPSYDSPVAVLERELFRKIRPGDRQRAHAPGNIEIIEAPTELREVEEIAREAKRLVLECGYEPDDIAVIFRTLDVYAPLVRDTFKNYGLPCRVARAEPLSRNPAVKALLSAIAVEESDWERDDVIGLVKSNYVELGNDAPDLMPERLERWARRTAVLRGKTQWLERLARKMRAMESRADLFDEDEVVSERDTHLLEQKRRKQVADIDEVIKFVRELASILGVLPREGTVNDYVRAICEMVVRLGIRDAILKVNIPEMLRSDLSAYTRFLEVLGELEYADAPQNGTPRRYALSEFYTRLRHALGRTLTVEPRGADGKISVLDVYQARHDRYRVVFIGGMVERVFPQPHDQDPLYNDSARRKLAKRGIALQERGAEDVEEVFLFYNAITRATEKIYLTYPMTDAKGQPRMQSFYVDEVLRIVEPPVEPAKLLYSEPVPETGAVWNAPDLGQWLFNALWTRRCVSERRANALALYNGAVETQLEQVRSSILNAFVEERRQSTEPPDKYDGVISRAEALRDIAEMFPQEHVFSASALSDYGSCPFRYFCKRVLDLEPLEEPEEEISAIDRGNLYHRILWRFYTELRDERSGETRFFEKERTEIVNHILRVAAQECDRFEEAGFVANKPLWRLARRAIERNIQRFVDHEIELERKHRGRHPAYFELCFGMELQPPYDPNSTREPLIVDGVRLAGKIDRVDIAPGQHACVVVDYKTGDAKTTWQDVAAGTSFQLPVYWLACEELLLLGRKIKCEEAYFYRLCGDYAEATQGLRRRGTEWEASLAQCRTYIKRYAESIRAGKFPVAPSDTCPGWCEYRDICRYDRGRIERKAESPSATDDESRPDEDPFTAYPERRHEV